MQEKPAETLPSQSQQQQQYQTPEIAPLVVTTESGPANVGGEEDRIMALINQADDWQ